jgi:hypothetical protein
MGTPLKQSYLLELFQIYPRTRCFAPLSVGDPEWDRNYFQYSEFNEISPKPCPNVYRVLGDAKRGETPSGLRISLKPVGFQQKPIFVILNQYRKKSPDLIGSGKKYLSATTSQIRFIYLII